jgi:hypothetical protein
MTLKDPPTFIKHPRGASNYHIHQTPESVFANGASIPLASSDRPPCGPLFDNNFKPHHLPGILKYIEDSVNAGIMKYVDEDFVLCYNPVTAIDRENDPLHLRPRFLMDTSRTINPYTMKFKVYTPNLDNLHDFVGGNEGRYCSDHSSCL